MKPLRPLLCLIALLSMASALHAQPVGARSLKDYQHRVWTQQDGAPDDISGMVQTTDGWLWVGGSNGLFRFDGVNFERYQPAGHPGLARMQVIEMLAADNGDLYVSNFPKDVVVIRPDASMELLPAPDDYRPIPPRAMAIDRDGSLWTIGHGIRRYKDGLWTTVESGAQWKEDVQYSMLLDQDDRLWAAAPAGVWLLDRARARFDKVSDRSGGLALSPGGDVWLLGAGGSLATRLSGPGATRSRPPRAAALVSRSRGQFTSDGTLWALGCPDTACLVHGAAGHRADLHPARQANERVASVEGAAGQENLGMIEDREGNIWVFAQDGVSRFRPKRFLVPSPRLELNDLFYSAAMDGAGNVWIAERSSGKLWRLGPDGVPTVEPGPPVQLLGSGRDGALLKADRRSVTRVLGDSVETIPLPPGPNGKPVDRRLLGLLDDGKRLWTAAADVGAIAWSEGKWRTSAEIGLPNQIYLTAAAGPGQLWLVRANGELVFFDQGTLTRYDATPVGVATGIFPGRRLVLGGANGLAVLKDGKLQLLRASDPDALRGVSGIAVTANGDRWLNGVGGVIRVRESDWQAALDRPGQLLRYELFGTADGYPGRASISWRAPTAFSADGRHVWFIATLGIVGLDSKDLRRNTVAPQPVVLDISTDDARFDVSRHLQLPPGSQNFRVRFTASSLRHPERTRFEFRLDGVDSGWRDAGNLRTTSYTNVGPGAYVFRVRAFNEDGVASKQDAAVSIAIEPTLVQSLPFKLAMAACLAALLVMLYRVRVRYLTRRIVERLEIKTGERERIARTLHDTFLQTVYLLLLRLRKFAARLPDKDGARQELQAILDQARMVIDAGRDQVHELRVTPRTLEESLQDCAASLRALHPGVDFALRSDGVAAGADQAVIDEAGAIACEALRNAFTHARARHIAATVRHGRRELRVTVEDDGEGIDPEVIEAGRRDGHWGLVGMRERALRIGARLELRGRDGRGTVMVLQVPLAQDGA